MAFALVRPRTMTMSELRRALPATTLAKMMIHGALLGVLPRYNDRGEEDGPADPLSAAQRIDLADKLMKKILPDLKTDEPVDAPHTDGSSLPTDPEQLRRFTTDQLRAAIEADFTSQYEALPHARPVAPEAPQSAIPATPTPAAADVPGTAGSGAEPPRKKRARAVPPPKSG